MSNELVNQAVVSCCISLFEAYGHTITHITTPSSNESPQICSILGFTGDLRGATILAMTNACVAATSPIANSQGWIGELVNQLVGRVKNELLRYGVEIALSTPVTLRGERLAAVGSGTELPLLFHSDHGDICIWFDFEARAELIWQPPTEVATSEGDAMFF